MLKFIYFLFYVEDGHKYKYKHYHIHTYIHTYAEHVSKSGTFRGD
jgi:hypothetical protein